MAVTVTAVDVTYPNLKCWDIVATADADTTATIAHGFGVIPTYVWGQQLLSQALTALSGWTLAFDATNVTATKLTSAGSGNAAAQFRVYAFRPHSVVRQVIM